MKPKDASESYYIGWDVGGWNCDRNAKSQDAIVILDSELAIVGIPWYGNLRETINNSRTPREFIQSLFMNCIKELPDTCRSVTLAIDTPLGFSDEFRLLLSAGVSADTIGDSRDNPYLYRKTERFLFDNGLKPLSPVMHMIGSQATKGMHVLSRFAPRVKSCGVWTDGELLTAIEAYPSSCRNSQTIQTMLAGQESLGNRDLDDARLCAFIAYLFSQDNTKLAYPDPDVSDREGWIWVPEDCLQGLFR